MRNIFIWALCLFFCLSCEQNNTKEVSQKNGKYPVTVIDINDKIIISKKPEKIVVAGTSLYAEILMDLGVSQKIVGISYSKNIPTLLQSIQSVGTPLQPNLEQIISLQPDIVFGITYSFRAKLEQLSIPVFIAGAPPYGIIDSLEELYKAIKNIDKIVHGDTKKAIQLITNIKKRIEKTEEQIRNEKEVKIAIVYVSSQAAPYVIGKNSLENTLISKAKGQNVFEKSGTINLEVFIDKDPDIIITDPSQIQILQKNAAWKTLKAVKNNKVFGIDASSWTSSHVLKTFEKLVEILHPNIIFRSKK